MVPYMTDNRFKVIVHPAFGRCLAVTDQIQKGSTVAAANGQVLDHPTIHSVQVAPRQHIHDPNFAGLIAHCCEPNLFFDPSTRTFTALRTIYPGDILTQDYELTEDALVTPFDCACGSKNCRGRIVGRLARAQDCVR